MASYRFLSVLGVLLLMGCGSDGGSTSGNDDVIQGQTADEAMSSLARSLTPDDKNLPTLTADNRAFGMDLYHKLAASNADKNLFMSPHSISIALAMTFAGARTDTATQMADAMNFTLVDAQLHEAFNALDLALATRGSETVDADKGAPFRLDVVNAIWGQKGVTFLSDYLDLLALNYGAGLRLLDFMTDPDGARKVINDWVEDQTEDRIKDLLPEGSIDGSTRLVLTNAIYFKANWDKLFDKDLTQDTTFHAVGDTDVQASMMHVNGTFQYAKGDAYQVVELPYVGGQVSMFVMVPDAGTFDSFESGLNGAKLGQIIASVSSSNGNLSLPKFSFESSFSLKDALAALGMPDAFTSVADFSGMDGAKDFMIGDVFHKSFVAVDEKGTEAAAATAVVMENTSMPANTFDLTVDRPFMFVIVDKPTGAVLFLGRVLNPAA